MGTVELIPEILTIHEIPRAREIALVLALGAVVCFVPSVSSAQSAEDKTAAPPLPEGVIARLGTIHRQSLYYTDRVRFTPDGKTIQTASSYHCLYCEWNSNTGAFQRLLPVVKDLPGIRDFTPDLTAYAIEVGEDRLRIVQTLSGRTIREWLQPPSNISSLKAVSPDAKQFALYGIKQYPAGQFPRDPYFVAIWNINSRVPKLLEGLVGQVNHVCFSADGKRVAIVCWAGNEGDVSCWATETGKRLWGTRQPDGIFATTLFSPDGRSLIVRLSGRAGDRLENWDPATGKPRLEWQLSTGVGIEPRTFSPDSKLLLFNDSKQIRALDVGTGKERYTVPVNDGPVAFAPDGKSFVTVRPILQRWDSATGEPVWKDTTERGHVYPVWGLSISPDRQHLASIDAENHLMVWNLTSRQATRIKEKFSSPLAFARNGRTLFAVSPSGAIVVGIDPLTGKRLVTLSTEGVFDASARIGAIRVIANGRVSADLTLYEDAVRGDDATVEWDVKSGKVVEKSVSIHDPERATARARNRFIASHRTPDEKSEVVLYVDRLVVRDVATGKEVLSRPVPETEGPWIHLMAVSADGLLAATAHPLGSILLWDLSRKRAGK